ncbi:MAG: hypothetical protein IPL96_03730 [Holophagaceae bacterium]|nr:hypothetical protein [Holophagaceae bacterium]
MRTLARTLLAPALILALAGCSGGEPSPECNGQSPAPPPYARVAAVDGTPFGTSSYDIPVTRTAGTSRTITLTYAVQRVGGGWCTGLYTGPLTLRALGLPQGASATFTPANLPAIQSLAETQTLSATLTIGPTVPDGRVALALVSSEVEGPCTPAYTLVLSTTP